VAQAQDLADDDDGDDDDDEGREGGRGEVGRKEADREQRKWGVRAIERPMCRFINFCMTQCGGHNRSCNHPV
jgi:hypothetical protein